ESHDFAKLSESSTVVIHQSAHRVSKGKIRMTFLAPFCYHCSIFRELSSFGTINNFPRLFANN
ncbi:hypothetical protein ACKI1S_49020, partial [Streptomyces galilaeus]